MRSVKKILSIIILAAIISGFIPATFNVSFAAGDANLAYESYDSGTLNIKWDTVTPRGITVVTYHAPESPAADKSVTKTLLATDPCKLTITGLKNDYIYDIQVDIYDTDGNIIYTDKMKFLPQISLYANYIDQQPVDDPAGGRESGVIPTLKVSWAVPKVYDPISKTFINVSDTAAFKLIDNNMADFSYTLNITDSSQKSDIKINYDSVSNKYRVRVAGDTDASRVADVNYDNATGRYYFYLVGVKDDNAVLPTITDISNAQGDLSQVKFPKAIQTAPGNEYKYILPNKEIRPGTVYYMKINSLYYMADKSYIDAIVSGPSGNPLVGQSYCFTPIRFQLTKNSLNNVNVKIYKINKGSLSLPQMYYSLQLNSAPVNGDWSNSPYKDKAKTLDGTYFNGEFAYTVVTGVSINNDVYYRVQVRSNTSTDKIDSMTTLYKISNDTSRPPVPQNVTAVATTLKSGKVTARVDGVHDTQIDAKSSNVLVSWDKPANWDSIKGNLPNDIYFYFTLNTSQSESTTTPDLIADGQNFGQYKLSYRLVKYISANSPNIKVNGNRLEYTINAFDLFNWEDNTGAVNGGVPAATITNADGYPNAFLPNKTYYLRMYTTLVADKGTAEGDPGASTKMSDKSLTVSFTTLSATQRDVPLPANIQQMTGVDQSSKENYIQLQFDKVKVNWENYTLTHDPLDTVYYDIYMSTRTDPSSFVLIGTTQKLDKDIVFDKVTDPQSVYITAKIKNFTNGTTYTGTDSTVYDPYSVFGTKLMPNTTYYFKIKTRLDFVNPPSSKESIFTAIIPVTTGRSDINSGDESTKRHAAPIDFAIYKDVSGNLAVSGQKVTFSWTKRENGIKYALICTPAKVGTDGPLPTSDTMYRSFNKEFSATHNEAVIMTLDTSDLTNLPDGLEYDKTTNTFKYTISRWLFPNKLYYFSLRAEGGTISPSVWISIPVTTSLIEGPTALAPVNDSELAFQWTDPTDVTAKVEDYRVSIKEQSASTYTVLTRSQANIVMDVGSTDTDFYGRIYNLKSNKAYDVKVERAIMAGGVLTYQTVYPKAPSGGLKTKDDDHQLEVMWKGLPVDDYSYFEIAIKRQEDTDYTTLTAADLEEYADLDGNDFPYYIEKTAQTTGTAYSIYHAKIKTMEITLADGTKSHQPLKSNTKYSIKVRGIKIDPSGGMPPTYSKYIGPIDTRTEFNQSDYDQTDEDLKKTATFLDKIAKLEESMYWKMDTGNGTTNKIFLKGEKVVNEIENMGNYPFTLDISDLGQYVDIDNVYIPVSVAELLSKQNKTFTLKTKGAEFTLKPNTLDIENMSEAATVEGKPGVNDLYLKMNVSRIDYPSAILPAGASKAAKIEDLKVYTLGTSKTDEELKKLFHDELYDDTTGLIKKKTDLLKSNTNSSTMSQQKVNQYIDQLVKEVESEMGDYIKTTVEGSGGTGGMILARESVKAFTQPMTTKIVTGNEPGLKIPYVCYDGSTTWQKLTGNVTVSPGSVTFNAVKPGKFSVLYMTPVTGSLSQDYWAKESIEKFVFKYDVSDIFPGISKSFNPELSVSAKEMVLLYEKIMNKTIANSGLDIKQKAKKMGLDSILNLNGMDKDIQRQEAAAILIKLYAAKQGLKEDSLSTGKNVYIEDENDIGNRFYKSCAIAVNLNLISLDDNGNFLPEEAMTRAEVINAFEKVLELTGDIK